MGCPKESGVKTNHTSKEALCTQYPVVGQESLSSDSGMQPEIRWYKGKYKVEIVLKSKGNYRVKLLEPITSRTRNIHYNIKIFPKGHEFTTVPRLLWRHPRK